MYVKLRARYLGLAIALVFAAVLAFVMLQFFNVQRAVNPIKPSAIVIVNSPQGVVYFSSSPYCSISTMASFSSYVTNGLNITQISLTAWTGGKTVNYPDLLNICNRGPYAFSITLNAGGAVSAANAEYVSSLMVYQYGNTNNYVAFSGVSVAKASTTAITLQPGQCATFGIAVTTTTSATTSAQGPTYQVNILASAGDLEILLEIMYISVYINGIIPLPVVYQGITSYGPTKAFPYYSPMLESIGQPNLVLVPARPGSAGAMFWNYQYSGGSVTITLLGTFTGGLYPYADGYVAYFFITPSGWASSAYNYSIPYSHAPKIPNIASGAIILPQSFSPYFLVQWDPFYRYGNTAGNGGQFNIWVISPPYTISYTFNGIGSGAFMPNPGDLICFTATYDARTNTVTAYAVDLNTGAVASVSQSLVGYFAPPPPGAYALGIGAGTGDNYADWRALYVAYK